MLLATFEMPKRLFQVPEHYDVLVPSPTATGVIRACLVFRDLAVNSSNFLHPVFLLHVAINQAAGTPTLRQSGGSKAVIQRAGSGPGGALSRVVGEGLSRSEQLSPQGWEGASHCKTSAGETLNNAVSGGTIIIIRVPLFQMEKLRPRRLQYFL